MLYANTFGLEVIQPAYPLDGLGAYVEGVCKEGKDFVCSEVNGLHSCRPCSYAQLAMFKDLQGQLNRLVRAKGLSARYLLDIDGRIGALTAATLGVVSKATMPTLAPPVIARPAITAAQTAPKLAATHRAIAIVTPELDAWSREVAKLVGATETIPTPPTIPGGGGGSGPIVPPGPDISTAAGQLKRPGAGPLLAMTGGVLGLGLVAYGIQRYRARHA